MKGKTWMIPENVIKPNRQHRHFRKKPLLLQALKREKESKTSGGIYHKIQIEMTYNSNHMEGSKLTHDKTRFIFETKTLGTNDARVNVDDTIETTNHFRCIDYVIDNVKSKLAESFTKQLHFTLKSSASDTSNSWFMVGDYKLMPNEVGGNETTDSSLVKQEISALLKEYNKKDNKTFEDIVEFHKRFEDIHPFQGGNGRVGRLIILKGCLANNIVPTLITDDAKLFYYRGFKEYYIESEYLVNTPQTLPRY